MQSIPHLLEHAIAYKTGKPPKPIEDYDPMTAQALVWGWDDVRKVVEQVIDESDEWAWTTVLEEQPDGRYRTIRKPIRKVSYDEPVGPTGDPVADRWEEQLARGEEPDW